MANDLSKLMTELGGSARLSAKYLAKSSNQQRNKAISCIAKSIQKNTNKILESNSLDIKMAEEKDLPESMIDRLMLDKDRINSMASSMNIITQIEDPINKIREEWSRPNGMMIQKVSVPLGVIGIIYESRPNVTADAAALCIKSANSAILRGGSESFESNIAIYLCIREGLVDAGLDPLSIQLVPTKQRSAVGYMLSSMSNWIDVIVPRGGKSLVRRVQDEARIPVIGHLEGICHVYVHQSADLKMAREIILNAKMRRTGICGAAETVLVDKNIAAEIVPDLVDDLSTAGCEIRGDREIKEISSQALEASEEDWSTEYLDAVISIKIVKDHDEAISHISDYGSGHTDSIVTEDNEIADKFIKEVDSAIVMHNTSTQFADGGEFGMGAEIGIATGRIHARGPVGATQLTSYKYAVRGNGQVRP